jgi:aspartyl-tRNA(Asn)/glutamyl-tRNA(Gln) amidotransferase subunit B
MKPKMGLEIHVHVLTKSKFFCSCPTDYEDKEPNQNTCPICLGFPGSKPKANKKVIDSAIMVAKALNCKVNNETFFSRKSYFYPDMPKNFQITQYEIPLATKGYLEILRHVRIKI